MRRAPLLVLILLASACGASGEQVSQARKAAVDFYAAFAAHDGAAACALLAPETVHQVEKTGKTPCDQAVGDEELPAPSEVTATTVFGNEGKVVFSDDTVFVSQFAAAWKVVAAGCQPRGGGPYDCQIEGA